MNKRSYVAAAQQALVAEVELEEECAPHPADVARRSGEYAAAPPLRLVREGEALAPPLRPDHVFDPMGGTIPGEEPVFVLRGGDASAPIVMQMWIDLNRENCPHLMEAAHDMQRRMQQWPDRRAAGWKATPEEDTHA